MLWQEESPAPLSCLPCLFRRWIGHVSSCRLRPARQTDLPALHAAVTDPRFPPDLPLAQMARTDQLAEWLARLTTPHVDTRLWSITPVGDDACIGQIGLIPIENADAHWVSYWLSPDLQGKGVAGAALAALTDAALARPGYIRLVAMIAVDNRASIAAIRYAGFVATLAPDIPAISSPACDTFERCGGERGRIP